MLETTLKQLNKSSVVFLEIVIKGPEYITNTGPSYILKDNSSVNIFSKYCRCHTEYFIIVLFFPVGTWLWIHLWYVANWFQVPLMHGCDARNVPSSIPTPCSALQVKQRRLCLDQPSVGFSVLSVFSSCFITRTKSSSCRTDIRVNGAF